MLMEIMETKTSSKSFCENFTCSLCSYATSKLRKIQKHFRKQHSITDLLQCPFCKYVVTEETLFFQHKQAVHPKDRFSCNVCKFSTRKWTRWKRHVINGHSQSLGKKDGAKQQKKNILTQQNFVDNGIENSDDIISIVLKQVEMNGNDNFENVINTGTTEQQKTQLKNHCPFCKESFQTSSEFQTHIFKHTFDSPYSCQHCSYCCSDEEILIKHIAFLHKIESGSTAKKPLKLKTKECDHRKTLSEESTAESSEPTNTQLQDSEKSLVIRKSSSNDVVVHSFDSIGLPPKRKREDTHSDLLNVAKAKDNDKTCVVFTESVKTSAYMKQESGNTSGLSSKVCTKDNQAREDYVVEALAGDSEQVIDFENTKDSQVCTNEEQKQDSDELEKNTDVVSFSCEHCSRTFNNKKSFTQHMSTHENKMSFACEVCSKVYKTMNSLKCHLVKHTNDGAYSCEVCSKSFLYKSQLETHILVHTNNKCQQTFFFSKGKRFLKEKSYLTQHIEPCMSDNLYVCEYCEKCFTCQSALKTHMISHTDKRPYVCKLCGKSFKSKRSLKMHENFHADISMSSMCEYCHKSFSCKKTLAVHMRLHRGEKPYRCSYCNYSASQSGTLLLHERSHRGDRPYKCDVCEFRAVRLSILTEHYRIHTGEKPYQCEVCLKYFRQKSSINSHKRIVHQIYNRPTVFPVLSL